MEIMEIMEITSKIILLAVFISLPAFGAIITETDFEKIKDNAFIFYPLLVLEVIFILVKELFKFLLLKFLQLFLALKK